MVIIVKGGTITKGSNVAQVDNKGMITRVITRSGKDSKNIKKRSSASSRGVKDISIEESIKANVPVTQASSRTTQERIVDPSGKTLSPYEVAVIKQTSGAATDVKTGETVYYSSKKENTAIPKLKNNFNGGTVEKYKAEGNFFERTNTKLAMASDRQEQKGNPYAAFSISAVRSVPATFSALSNPKRTLKSLSYALSNPVKTVKGIGAEIERSPASFSGGIFGDILLFKGLGKLGTFAKESLTPVKTVKFGQGSIVSTETTTGTVDITTQGGVFAAGKKTYVVESLSKAITKPDIENTFLTSQTSQISIKNIGKTGITKETKAASFGTGSTFPTAGGSDAISVFDETTKVMLKKPLFKTSKTVSSLQTTGQGESTIVSISKSSPFTKKPSLTGQKPSDIDVTFIKDAGSINYNGQNVVFKDFFTAGRGKEVFKEFDNKFKINKGKVNPISLEQTSGNNAVLVQETTGVSKQFLSQKETLKGLVQEVKYQESAALGEKISSSSPSATLSKTLAKDRVINLNNKPVVNTQEYDYKTTYKDVVIGKKIISSESTGDLNKVTSLSDSKFSTLSDSIQKRKSSSKSDSIIKEIVIDDTITSQKIKTLPSIKTKSLITNRVITSPSPLIPSRSLTGFLPDFNKKQPSFSNYEVIIGREGNKIRDVFSASSLFEAATLGRKKVSGSAAASFRVLENGRNLDVSEVSKVRSFLGSDYGLSTKISDSFVQKRDKRISSLGEKKDISFRGGSGLTKDSKSFSNALKLVKSGLSLREARLRK